MATSTPRRRTPPVNAELFRIERAGEQLWTGSEPAFLLTRSEWIATSTGARVNHDSSELSVPLLERPVPPEPEYPDEYPPIEPPDEPDPEPPPETPPGGYPDYPYDPPSGSPSVPDTGTYQAALAGMMGYGSAGPAVWRLSWMYEAATPELAWKQSVDPWYGLNRNSGSADDVHRWAVDINFGIPGAVLIYGDVGSWHAAPAGGNLFHGIESVDGLHWTLGAVDGTIDQTGAGHHGDPSTAVQLGAMPGKTRVGDGAAYFPGGAAYIVSDCAPWTVGVLTGAERTAHLAAYPASAYEGYGPPFGSFEHHYDDLPWYPPPARASSLEVLPHGTGWTMPGGGIDVHHWYEEASFTVMAWVRRQNTAADHTLVSSSGPDSFRFYLPAGSRQPRFEGPENEPDPLGSAGGAQGSWEAGGVATWAQCWPVNQDTWTHFALTISARGFFGDPTVGRVELAVNGQSVRMSDGYHSYGAVPVPGPVKWVEGVGGARELVAADPGGIVAGHATSGWRGAMDEFAVLVQRRATRPEDPGPPYLNYAESDYAATMVDGGWTPSLATLVATDPAPAAVVFTSAPSAPAQLSTIETADSAPFYFDYIYPGPMTGHVPPAGQVYSNGQLGTDPAGITLMRVSTVDADTNPFSTLSAVVAGSALRVESATDPDKWGEFTATATADAHEAYTDVFVAYSTGGTVALDDTGDYVLAVTVDLPVERLDFRNGDRVFYRHDGQERDMTVRGIENRADFGFMRLTGS